MMTEIELLQQEIKAAQHELKDVRIEWRLISAVLAFELAKDMSTGSMWIMSTQSVTGRIAQLSTYPTAIAVLWTLLAIAVVPYLLLQVFSVGMRFATSTTRLACRAILASGVIWCYLGYLSKNLDYTYVTEIFIVNGLTCIAMAAVMANGLNSAQRRAKESAK